MEIKDYYDDLDNSDGVINLHEQVRESLTLDDLISVVVCKIIKADNHRFVDKKLEKLYW